jgi:hypothetical protein
MTAHDMPPTPTASASPAAAASSEAPTLPAAPAAPLLDTDQASDLLDLVVYEQVLGCIDLDELYHLEQSLALSATGLPGISHQRGTELAKLMLDRAFRRLPDDIRTYLRAVEALACNGCELCEHEAREARSTRSPTGPRHGPRYKT